MPHVDPQYQSILPPLSTAEREALAADIAMNGVRVPIVVDETGAILDGYHRFAIAPDAPIEVNGGLTAGEKQAFVVRSNSVRRNLSPDQKKELSRKQREIAKLLRAEETAEGRTKRTQEEIATLLGVTQPAVSQWESADSISNIRSYNANMPSAPTPAYAPDVRMKVAPQVAPVIVQRLDAGETQAQVAADLGVSQGRVAQIAKKERKQATAKAEREALAATVQHDPALILGDFRVEGQHLQDACADLVFTDPPYNGEAVEDYRALGAFAARALKAGGLCLAYSGHAHLPAVIAALGESLTYGWTCAVLHTGGDLRFRNLRLQNGWKPVLLYYKPPLSAWWDWFPDLPPDAEIALPDTVSGGREKAEHPWQQAEAEAAHFIAALCPKGGLVIDPFAGSATTLAAAEALGMRYIGYEINEETYNAAQLRLSR